MPKSEGPDNKTSATDMAVSVLDALSICLIRQSRQPILNFLIPDISRTIAVSFPALLQYGQGKFCTRFT
jgi:hypothetical protein